MHVIYFAMSTSYIFKFVLFFLTASKKSKLKKDPPTDTKICHAKIVQLIKTTGEEEPFSIFGVKAADLLLVSV